MGFKFFFQISLSRTFCILYLCAIIHINMDGLALEWPQIISSVQNENFFVNIYLVNLFLDQQDGLTYGTRCPGTTFILWFVIVLVSLCYVLFCWTFQVVQQTLWMIAGPNAQQNQSPEFEDCKRYVCHIHFLPYKILIIYKCPGHALVHIFNSLAPGKLEWNFRHVIFKHILVIDGWGLSCEIALISMSLDVTDDKSTLVHGMAWCRQATSQPMLTQISVATWGD